MNAREYKAACAALGWEPHQVSKGIGVSRRSPFRWANGGKIREPEARLLRLLVLLRLPLSERKFHEMLSQIGWENRK